MKINYKINPQIFNINTKKQKHFLTKNNEFLLSHKLSITKTLSFIKKFQLDCILNTKSYNKALLKHILFKYKNNLFFSLNEKEKIYQQIKKEKVKKTKKLHNLLFSINEETAKAKKNNNRIYTIVLDQIKLLNFEIENKIKSIDFWIDQKNKIILEKSSLDKEKKEILNNNKDIYNLNISNIFDCNIENIRKILLYNNRKNMETKMKIDSISNKILNLKNMIKYYTIIKEIKNKNKNENEQLDKFIKTTITINYNDIIDIKNKDNSIYKEYDKVSFHSSLYTDSFAINKEEEFYLTKDNRNFGDVLNLSNDYINTDNSNNNHFSDKAIFNNEYINNKFSERNYIFSNISDNE